MQGRKYLGCETNNVAEYWGLLLGLRHAVGLVNVCREQITVSSLLHCALDDVSDAVIYLCVYPSHTAAVYRMLPHIVVQCT